MIQKAVEQGFEFKDPQAVLYTTA